MDKERAQCARNFASTLGIEAEEIIARNIARMFGCAATVILTRIQSMSWLVSAIECIYIGYEYLQRESNAEVALIQAWSKRPIGQRK